jgi:MFS superfamily sulfate permease-like transporter
MWTEEQWSRFNRETRRWAKRVCRRVGEAASGYAGFKFPDLDIKFLGLGKHRHWAFHSALLGLVALALLYAWLRWGGASPSTQYFGRLALWMTIGLAFHLFTDTPLGGSGRKAMIWPFFLAGIPFAWWVHAGWIALNCVLAGLVAIQMVMMLRETAASNPPATI